MKTRLLLGILLFSLTHQLKAQIGELIPDSTFNYTSTVVRDSVVTNRLLVLDDGRIICAGAIREVIPQVGVFSDFSVSCLMPDGSIDYSFANNGYLTIDSGYTDEAFWRVEKFNSGILLIGYYNTQSSGNQYTRPFGDCYITKIDLSGNIDASFGNNGVVQLSMSPTFNVSDVKFDSNNNIFLLFNQDAFFGNNYQGKIIKLSQNGAIDTSFGNLGIAEVPAYTSHAMNILQDGSFVVLSNDTSIYLPYPFTNPNSTWQSVHLCKLDSSGAIDSTFGINGRKLVPSNNLGHLAWSGVSHPNGFFTFGFQGSYVSSYDEHYIYKITNTGELDSTFSTDGRVQINVIDTNSFSNRWPLYTQNLKFHNNSLWVYSYTEVRSMNCQYKNIFRIDEFGVQDTSLGFFGFSNSPVFDAALWDSLMINFVPCYEYSAWRDLAFQSDGKIIASGSVGLMDTTITTIPNGYIVSRLNPESNIITKTQDIKHNQSFSIYPNPTSGDVTLRLPSIANLEIYNMQGQLVLGIENVSPNETISLEGLRAGVYIAKASTTTEVFNKKFIKR